MSKSYKVAKKTINMGDKKGQTVYSVRPYSYGTLTTEEVANQIAVESTAIPLHPGNGQKRRNEAGLHQSLRKRS